MGFIEELYRGNINLSEMQREVSDRYNRASEVFFDREEKLLSKLKGENLILFNELLEACNDINDETSLANFKLGFRLGADMFKDIC